MAAAAMDEVRAVRRRPGPPGLRQVNGKLPSPARETLDAGLLLRKTFSRRHGPSVNLVKAIDSACPPTGQTIACDPVLAGLPDSPARRTKSNGAPSRQERKRGQASQAHDEAQEEEEKKTLVPPWSDRRFATDPTNRPSISARDHAATR